jgi:5-methylcytosine-specific restriction endonuclease McrA
MRTLKSKRKKQLNAGFVEDVTYDAIYQKDKGICQVCGLPVHPLKGIDNNWDGTVDHILPLSLGGEHSMANCQLAHRICNSLKGQASDGFTLDWEAKSAENNYWNTKYQMYLELMRDTPA